MYKFYFSLWLHWAIRITLCSIVLSASLSLIITLILYLQSSMQALDQEAVAALSDIFLFWFFILWNATLLIALFRSLKYIFNHCYRNYKIELYGCDTQKIQDIGYGDLVKIWRRWMMSIIWLVGVQMVVVFICMRLFSSYEGVFEWFNIYILYFFILHSGYYSFILLGARSKQVKVVRCSSL